MEAMPSDVESCEEPDATQCNLIGYTMAEPFCPGCRRIHKKE